MVQRRGRISQKFMNFNEWLNKEYVDSNDSEEKLVEKAWDACKQETLRILQNKDNYTFTNYENFLALDTKLVIEKIKEL